MAELQSLQGRVYAITGGSKGMGLRYARALNAEGAHVAILARPSAALDAVAAEIPEALALPCDVANLDDVKRAFAAIKDRHGKLHGLINNAGSCLPHTIADATDQEIHSQVGTNLLGPIYTVRAAVPLMIAAGGGDIINVSSESVRIPFPLLALYAATKAGLESLTQGLRQELRPHGIRVMALRVGQVSESSLGTHWQPDRAVEFSQAIVDAGVKDNVPMSPETTASMVLHVLRMPREANVDLMELRAY